MAKSVKQLQALWKKATTQAQKDKIHAQADKLRGHKTTTIQLGSKLYQAPVKKGETISAAPVAKKTVKPVAPVASAYRNASAQTTVTHAQQLKNNQTFNTELKGKQGAIAAGAAGVGTGLVGGGIKYMAPENQKLVENNKNLKTAFTVGQVAGSLPGFIAPYSAASKGIGEATKLIPSVAKLGKVGQGVVRSVATDLAVGTPLNTLNAVGSEKLKGKEALKNIALNTGINVATGGIMESLPAVAKLVKGGLLERTGGVKLKTGETVDTKEAFDLLNTAQKTEVAQKIAPEVKPSEIRTAIDDAAKTESAPSTPTLKAENRPAQPVYPISQATVPKEQAIAQTGDLKTSVPGKDLGADNLKYPLNMKLSEFKSNTLNNTPNLPDEAKSQLKDEDFMNPVISERQQLAEANQRIQTDPDGEFKDLQHKEVYDGVDTTTALELMHKYAAEGMQNGDFSKVIQLAKATHEKIHGNAQSLQALAKYTRTPEGAVIKAQQEVSAAEREIAKANPNKIAKVDKEAKQVTGAIDKAKAESADELGKIFENTVSKTRTTKLRPELGNPITSTGQAVAKLTDKNLGEIIGKYTEDAVNKLTAKADILRVNTSHGTAPLQSAFDDLTKELSKVAEETLPKAKTAAKSEIKATDILKTAIENKKNYQGVWTQAKFNLQKKYANNPEAMQLLSDFFDKDIVPTVSNRTMNKAITQTAKDFGVDLRKIVKESKGDKDKLARDMQNYITYVSGATGEDAKALAADVLKQYNDVIKTKTESVLKQMFPSAFGKQPAIVAKKTPMQKIMDLINTGAYDNEAIKDVIRTKNKIPVLENSDIKTILDKMEQAKAKPDGSYDQRKLESEVAYLIANKMPATGVEKVQAAQRILMLLNPKSTLVRNPLGNAMLGVLESVKNVPATGIDKLVSLKTGERTTVIAPLQKGKAELKGSGQGLKEWAMDIKNHVNTSPTGGQVDIPKKTAIFTEDHNISNPQVKDMMDTAGKIGNAVHGVVSHMLQLGDRPFYQGAYNARVKELEILDKMNHTTTSSETIHELAKEHALERTLQNDSWLSGKFLKLGADKSDPVWWRLLVHLIMPFKQTPANILDKFIDYSGLGVLKATSHALSTAGKSTLEKKVFNQKYFVDTMGRGLTGGGLAVLGYLMAKNGLATGGYDPNNKVEGMETALGKANYAFKIGDTYQTFDWALPASAPIAVGVAFYDGAAKAKEGQNATAKALESAVNLLFNSTVLQGPSKLMSGYSPAASIGAALMGVTTQATPTAGKQISQLIDPYVRETYNPKGWKQTINKTIARIPFASETLPIKQDVFGNDVKSYQGKNNAFNVMINPGFTTKYNPDAEQKEVMRLYKDQGLTNQLPVVAPKEFTKDGRKYVFEAGDYVKYQKTVGQYSHRKVSELIQTDGYQSMSDTDKAAAIQKVNEAATNQAIAEYFSNNGISPVMVLSASQQAKYAAVAPMGVQADQYLKTYDVTRGVVSSKDDNGKTIYLSESVNKKQAIDNANPNASTAELRALYSAFDVSEKVW